MRLRRRPELPIGVRKAVSGERVLAAGRAGEETWLVGTRDALCVVAEPGHLRDRLPWERVQRADWDAETETLRVERTVDYGRPVVPLTFRLTEPGTVLPLVRERVSASVVVQRRVELTSRQGLVVIGRRPPSGAGEVSWAFELDAGVDPDDPAVRAASEAALRDAQESLGL